MKLLDLLTSSTHLNNQVQRPYIIAEAGVNHEGNMEIALRLIEEAADSGANAIKFQTYKAETIASKNSPSYWDLSKEVINSQYKLFKKYDRFWKGEFEILKKHCDHVGIEFMSTPFDVESAKFLNELMDVFKISSSDINNKPFIEYLCKFDKPIILSTGASYMWEIKESVSWIKKHGNQVALLHCILNYPTSDENASLAMITSLKDQFQDNIIGYSDHTLPKEMKNLEVATLLGARILEKHFTHDKSIPGNDHYHSMDKNDLKTFIKRINSLMKLLGEQTRKPLESENIARANARRSLVAARSINVGQKIVADDITWKRPGSGIDPRDFERLVGSSAKCNINEDDVLQWEMFK